MSFQTQIEDLAGINLSADTTSLNDYLTATAREVADALPVNLLIRNATVATDTSNPFSVANMRILNITRNGRYANEIPYGMSAATADSGSIFFTDSNGRDPVFYYKGSDLYVLPAPDGDDPIHILRFAYPSVTYDASDITNFPDNAEYAVVLGATCKLLIRMISDAREALPTTLSISDLSIISIPPASPSVPSFTLPDVASTTVSSTAILNAGTPPTYTVPATTISGVAWATEYPSRVSGITYALGLISNAVSQAATAAGKFLTADSDSVFGDESTFLTADSQLTNVKQALDRVKAYVNGDEPSGTTDAHGAQADEDSELVSSALAIAQTEIQRAQMHLSEWTSIGDMRVKEVQVALQEADGYAKEVQALLSATPIKVQEYQIRVQDALNSFNDANVEYQAKLQEAIQQAQINAQKASQQAQIDSTEAQQETSLKLQKENQEYGASLQKFSAEVGKYQADVSKEVQEYQNNMQQKIQELTTNVQLQQAEIQTLSNQYQVCEGKYQQELQRLSGARAQ